MFALAYFCLFMGTDRRWEGGNAISSSLDPDERPHLRSPFIFLWRVGPDHMRWSWSVRPIPVGRMLGRPISFLRSFNDLLPPGASSSSVTGQFLVVVFVECFLRPLVFPAQDSSLSFRPGCPDLITFPRLLQQSVRSPCLLAALSSCISARPRVIWLPFPGAVSYHCGLTLPPAFFLFLVLRNPVYVNS